MKTHPILFRPEMVNAILNGSKTQTRRKMKVQYDGSDGPLQIGMFAPLMVDRYGEEYCGKEICGAFSSGGEWSLKSPYGMVCDFLYVKETYTVDRMFDHLPPSKIPQSGRKKVWYLADGPKPEWAGRTRSSIHMPRWASRIDLEITGLRAERLQDIKCFDIRMEGVDCPKHDFPGGMCTSECYFLREAYRLLWNRINGPGAYEANPYVWVYEFRKVAK